MTVPAAPPPPDFPWGPLLTGLGIVASLIWNFINTQLTRSIKKQDMRVEEFKRLRTRLDAATDDLRTTASSLRSLSVSVDTKASFAKKLEASNRELAENYAKLEVILSDLNRSRYASGTDWIDAMAPHWDNALGSLNGGYNSTKTLVEQKTSLADSASHLQTLITAIDKRIETEMARYASSVN